MRLLSNQELSEVSGGRLTDTLYPSIVNQINALISGMQTGNFHGSLNLLSYEALPAGTSQAAVDAYDTFMSGTSAVHNLAISDVYWDQLLQEYPSYNCTTPNGYNPYPQLLATLATDIGSNPFSSATSLDATLLEGRFQYDFITLDNYMPDFGAPDPTGGGGSMNFSPTAHGYWITTASGWQWQAQDQYGNNITV